MIFALLPYFIFSQFKISHFNALLQFKEERSNKAPHFTITSEGSCTNWTSMNPSVVRVIPNYEKARCSNSAVVEVVATGPERKATSVIATSTDGAVLKCDIFVDYIKNISILTTTKSIYVDSSVETLKVQAYDELRNIFTSLEGTDIKWTIDTKHLKTTGVDEAKMATPKFGNLSAMLIIKGKKIGKTWVAAELNGLKTKTDLIVVEPIALFPSPIVRVLPYTHIPFKLCSTKGNLNNEDELKCISQISLPSNQYTLKTSDESVLTTEQNASASAFKEGVSAIIATDNSIPDNTASSLVYVSYPFRVEQEIQYIALGDSPEFNPILYTKDGHKYDLFEPIQWEIEGDWSTVGRKEVILRYHDFSFIAIVIVCPPLKFDPEEAILPVDYNGYPLHISGGSGNYSFSIDNPSIIDYFNSRVQTYKEGTTVIHAYDRRIKKYQANATITVSKVEFIDIELEKRELLIGSTFEPKCDVYASGRKRFSVDVYSRLISSQTNVVSSKMIALHPGFSDIMCKADKTYSEKIKVSVADYLRVEMKGRTSPNSITPITLSGGVLQWPNSPKPDYLINCPGANTTMLQYNHFSIDREYSGECEVVMQNQKTKQNPIPLVIQQMFFLESSFVDKLVLHVTDERASTYTECNAPPRKVTKEVSNYYRIIPDHLHMLYLFAHDRFDNIINYYSIISFELRTSNNEVIKPLDTHGFNGETIYHYVPRQDVDLSIVSPDLETTIISLKSILPFYAESSKTVYYTPGKNYTFHIEGGSGIFTTTSKNGYIEKDNLVVYSQQPGISHYNLSDMCTDHLPLDIELNSLTVISLQIIAPVTTPVNTEFHPVVHAFGENNIPIPQSLLKYADIKLYPEEAEKIEIDAWKITPHQVGTLTLTAKASNGVKAEVNVTIVQPPKIVPQYITLLPGESEKIEIIEGPSDLEYNYGNGEIATVVGNEVVGVSPGKLTINVSVKGITDFVSYPIYVHVLTPTELRFEPSTENVIENGLLFLKLFVETLEGITRIPRKSQTSVSNQFPYIKFNASYLLINCTHDNTLNVEADAYGLSTIYSTSIETKLSLISPSQIRLPPLCSFDVKIFKDLHCQFTSENESIAICENGVIRAGPNEGNTIINVYYENQQVSINVEVSKPSFIHIHQIPPADFKIILLNPNGLEYSSTKGVEFSLEGPQGFENGGIDSTGFCSTGFSSQSMIELNGSAYNSQFSLSTSMNISVTQKVAPEDAFLQKGVSYQYRCTAAKPHWSISDRTIAYVTDDGIVTALRPGKATISCSNNVETTINVVEMTDLQIFNNIKDQYQIKPTFTNGIHESKVIKPNDLSVICELDSNCGSVHSISNVTGDFCIFEPNPTTHCSPKTKLKIALQSTKSHLYVSTDYLIGYSGTVDFGFPDNMQLLVSEINRKIEIPFKLKQSDINYDAPKGTIISFPKNGGIIIRVDDSFKGRKYVTIEHKISSERRTIEIVHEHSSSPQRSMFHTRDFHINQDILFYICLITLFGCIWYIIFMFTTSK